MSFSLADILTEEERDDVLATMLAIAALLDMPTTSWQDGNPILTMITTASQKLADLTSVAVEIAKGGFGELLPSDTWADLWAQSRFNETRVPAAQATGLVNLTNSEATQYDYDIGELILAHATTGKTYRNTAAISVLATVGLDDVAIAADEPGIASSASPGTITVIVSGGVGIASTNPLSLIGTDKETTLALVTRCRSKLGAFSPNGPKDAYNYVATTPAYTPGLSAPITRTRTVNASGTLSVYLAAAAGPPTAGDVVIVQSAIDTYAEPWGATATAVAGTGVTQAVTYQSWIQGSNLTAAQIEALQSAALAAYFAALDFAGDIIPPDGGSLYPDTLEQIISASVPGTKRVVVSVPAAAVPLDENEFAVLGTITPTTTLL